MQGLTKAYSWDITARIADQNRSPDSARADVTEFKTGVILDADMRDVSDRAIDSHIKNLRRKIQALAPGCECIASVCGVDYRFDAQSETG